MVSLGVFRINALDDKMTKNVVILVLNFLGVDYSLSHAEIGLLYGLNTNFWTSLPNLSYGCPSPQGSAVEYFYKLNLLLLLLLL